jgi:aspartate ammonia-lyase
MSEYRIEKDLLGERQIPNNVYWGIHTLRAIENFNISGRTVNKDLIHALALVKKACALANEELGYIDEKIADAICPVTDEICEGKLDNEFPVDAMQGGAGTSTNMNINEVIANRALEILGEEKGMYSIIHPIEHVNLHQSTNDVYPTGLKIAIILKLKILSEKIARTQGAFQIKEKEFASILKIARTQMQEAVPITLGLEFSSYSECLARDRWRLSKCEERIRVVNIGGTAVGTGITAARDYIFLVIEKLRDITGLGISRGENLIDITQNADSFVEISGLIKTHANNIIKICNNLRLLNLVKEINLSSMQTGSSIMPGKVNPVILEAGIQTGIKILANDEIINNAAISSTLELVEFMPLIADAMLESLDLLINFNSLFENYIYKISANKEECQKIFDNNPIIITAFVSHVGYDKAQELISGYNKSLHKNVREYLNQKLGKDLVDKVLSINNLIALGYVENE